MSVMLKWLLGFFLFTPLFGEISLKEMLFTAQEGSYVVTAQDKTCSFVYVRQVSDDVLVIEEASIPLTRFTRQKMGWKEWFESGGPGNTLWTVSRVNLQSGTFEQTYSYTHDGWIDMTEGNSFLATLLNLPFRELSDMERKKVNPTQRGTYKLWQPQCVVDGTVVNDVPFTAYRARWPKDGSELSNKKLEIYLPQTTDYAHFFPYWLEVDAKVTTVKMRVIDSGKGALSPKEAKIQHLSLTEEGLTIVCSIFDQDLSIMAEETDSFHGKIIPLPCHVEEVGKALVKLSIPKTILDAHLSKGESYTFLISSNKYPSTALSTTDTIIY